MKYYMSQISDFFEKMALTQLEKPSENGDTSRKSIRISILNNVDICLQHFTEYKSETNNVSLLSYGK